MIISISLRSKDIHNSEPLTSSDAVQVSLFDLAPHPYFELRLGDIVFIPPYLVPDRKRSEMVIQMSMGISGS